MCKIKAVSVEQVPCEICGQMTPFTETRRCNNCWELERRIQMYPELTKKILKDFEEAKGKPNEHNTV